MTSVGLWICGSGGVTRHDGVVWSTLNAADLLGIDAVYGVFEADDGLVAFGVIDAEPDRKRRQYRVETLDQANRIGGGVVGRHNRQRAAGSRG